MCISALHNSPHARLTRMDLACFALHRSCLHLCQPAVRDLSDPDFLHQVLPLWLVQVPAEHPLEGREYYFLGRIMQHAQLTASL